ncbi:LAME_0D08526g1_1 [Lachancea meyersii CBS 8951]|uniref:LAME_0D08526g1_1 n=1 Tax=Lachancea meyersii CBS 8951 TaxID=1266667 RepID=A0A1G4JAR7_9SACH|nr:LAME_0D08526g1_1 [Lachancea meyersii CBS 8951]
MLIKCELSPVNSKKRLKSRLLPALTAMERSKQTLYDTHINMYPPARKEPHSQRIAGGSPSRTVPYPVEDAQQPMSPVPLQSAQTLRSMRSTASLNSRSKTGTPTNPRYDQPFSFQSLASRGPSADSLMNAKPSNSSVDTFQSASEVSESTVPPPPYVETDAVETPRVLQEKLYRQPSDFSEFSEASDQVPRSNESAKSQERDFSHYSEVAKRFFDVYQATINDSPNFTAEIQMIWCETLLQYAFIDEFIANYNINGNKLKRTLTAAEMLKNQKIILEHALKVLTKLITLQHGPALYLMATLYSQQPYLEVKIQAVIARNDAKALDYYCKAAALDVSDACYRAGVCYEYQRGTSPELNRIRSLQKAIHYYEKGALNCDNIACMYKLGMLCLQGVKDSEGNQILKQEVKVAVNWFLRAIRRDEKVGERPETSEKAENETAKQHNGAADATKNDLVSPQAMYELAKVYEFDGLAPMLQDLLTAAGFSRNPTKALQYYHRCATRYQYPLAQWRIGQCYEFGQLNLALAANKSIAWYAKAATAKPRGNPMAMMSLSGWYLTGAKGVLKANNHEAFNWARKACHASEGKLARAEYAVGFFYENGVGCAVDLAAAREHYQKAANAGHIKAQERLRNNYDWSVG